MVKYFTPLDPDWAQNARGERLWAAGRARPPNLGRAQGPDRQVSDGSETEPSEAHEKTHPPRTIQ